jgi:hypothetical protein
MCPIILKSAPTGSECGGTGVCILICYPQVSFSERCFVSEPILQECKNLRQADRLGKDVVAAVQKTVSPATSLACVKRPGDSQSHLRCLHNLQQSIYLMHLDAYS